MVLKTMMVIITGIICLLKPLLVSNDYFSGVIIYEVEVQSKSNRFSSEYFQQMFGTQTTMIYEDAVYMQTYKNGSIEFDYLDAKAGKMFMKYSGTDTLLIYNANTEKDNILLQVIERVEHDKILNYDCTSIIMKLRNPFHNIEMSTTMFYSEDLKINHELFANTKRIILHEGYKIMKSIPLKLVMENEFYKMTSTAISIKHKNDQKIGQLFQDKSKGLVFRKIE